MHQDPADPTATDPTEQPDRCRPGWKRPATIAALALLAALLALGAYYPAQLAGAPLPRPQGDAALYAYQLRRAAECAGRWWQIGDDPRLGYPYPTEFAKHPGLFEGVDLMLLATLLPGSLSPAATYHLAVLTVLLINGAFAGWLALRYTNSALWAAAAVVLITLNEPVAARILGHLHLFKFSWVLLAFWAFVLFLERPSKRRGAFLGLALALVLQASFYLGFFMVVGLGLGFVLAIMAGRVQRSHGVPAVVAVLALALLGGLLCFPIWTASSEISGSGRYFHRSWGETWTYGSELWKYLVPRCSSLAQVYYRDIRGKSIPPYLDEAWFFPGYTVLLATVLAGTSRLRRNAVYSRSRTFVTVGLGMMAIWIVLSLSGGPGTLFYFLVPSFRCYGRAGLLVLATGSVLAPIVLCDFLQARRRGAIRAIWTLGVLAIMASDAWLGARSFRGWLRESEPPAWVEWLARQPQSVRMAAFAPAGRYPVEWWGLTSLEWLALHQHRTLCGGAFELFEGDLRLLGASYEQMNPAGLRFVASLGYEALAFHSDYLEANAWIGALSWLERVGQRGEWSIYRAKPEMARLPEITLDDLLSEVPRNTVGVDVPRECWITGSWPIGEERIVTGSDWAHVAWSDERGRLLSRPQPAFYQHLFGPGMPAYCVRTPARPGTYGLVVLDRHGRRRATIRHRVVADLAVSQQVLPARLPEVTVNSLLLPAGSQTSLLSFTLQNTSHRYLLSQVFREHLDAVSRTHPGLRSQWSKATAGAIVLSIAPVGVDTGESNEPREIPLPRDLAAGDRLTMTVPTDRLPPSWANRPLRVEPSFAQVGHREASPQSADLKISSGGLAAGLAHSDSGGERGNGTPKPAREERRR
jgi:hypothetical protein